MLSIIVACYNKEMFIQETVESVLKQTYGNWELILVDDASTDSTTQILDTFQTYSNIQVIKNVTNAGANKCRNQGIEMAKGDYCMFLDADDLLSTTCVEHRLNKAASIPGKNLYVFAMGVFKKSVGDDSREWQPNSDNPLRDFLKHKLPWSIMQPMWQTQFIREIGGFNESYKRLQDVELHTRALLNAATKVHLFPGTPDCFYRIDESRLNFNKFDFLSRWTEASIRFCDDFYKRLDPPYINSLKGTFYEVLCQLGFQKKQDAITQKEARVLMEKLYGSSFWKHFNSLDRWMWKIAYFNNFYLKISGVNYLLSRLITRY